MLSSVLTREQPDAEKKHFIHCDPLINNKVLTCLKFNQRSKKLLNNEACLSGVRAVHSAGHFLYFISRGGSKSWQNPRLNPEHSEPFWEGLYAQKLILMHYMILLLQKLVEVMIYWYDIFNHRHIFWLTQTVKVSPQWRTITDVLRFQLNLQEMNVSLWSCQKKWLKKPVC